MLFRPLTVLGLAMTTLSAQEKRDVFQPLDPVASKALIQVAPGYHLDLFASEPHLEEPVTAAWDGNGVMYVAEMRSYMQDVAGTDTKTARNGRIKRLEDTTGDGYPDKVTIFADGLNLPRMILPLDDRIAVTETDTTDVWYYRDTDGDGVADAKKLLWKGEQLDPNRSVEHQDSGLIWNLDNWIHVSYDYKRYRFTDGTWKKKSSPYIWAQWGLDHDETGQIFYSMNTEPCFSAQVPREYWSLISHRGGKMPRDPEPVSFGKPYDLSFLQMTKLCPIDDRGGKANPVHGMTSVGGQSVYRDIRLPLAHRKSYFVTDPTAHAVRQSVITNDRGRKFLVNPHGKTELLVSPDLYFRPINTHMGPDGAIYVIDMARGIIQDAPWLSEGPRKFIHENGVDRVKRRGRIWRVTHQAHPPRTQRPRMLKEDTVALVRHLSHPNGWWRSTAQKLIILRPDRVKALPHLKALVREGHDPLGRLHALWTLEGCDEVRDSLNFALKDADWRVRAAGVKISETLGEFGPLHSLANEPHPEVAKQLILTLGWASDPRALTTIGQVIENHPAHLGVTLAGTLALWQLPESQAPVIAKIRSGELFQSLPKSERPAAHTAWKEALAQWERGLEIGDEVTKDQARMIKAGEVLYFQSCVSCHGPDGRGTKVPGMSTALAPSLRDSKRVHGPLSGLMPVMINGLTGPIDGEHYAAGYMAPAAALGITRDDRLAELLSYIRYAWDGKSSPVTKTEVNEWRNKLQDRKTPWTDAELKAR